MQFKNVPQKKKICVSSSKLSFEDRIACFVNLEINAHNNENDDDDDDDVVHFLCYCLLNIFGYGWMTRLPLKCMFEYVCLLDNHDNDDDDDVVW